MDRRLFFAVGDLVANIAAGAAVGLLSQAIVGPGWNMWVAMLVMMAIGMIVGLLLYFPLSIVLGAMEVMVPLMFSGELSGMVVGMVVPMNSLSASGALLLGAASGLAAMLFIWIANAALRGNTPEADEVRDA